MGRCASRPLQEYGFSSLKSARRHHDNSSNLLTCVPREIKCWNQLQCLITKIKLFDNFCFPQARLAQSFFPRPRLLPRSGGLQLSSSASPTLLSPQSSKARDSSLPPGTVVADGRWRFRLLALCRRFQSAWRSCCALNPSALVGSKK